MVGRARAILNGSSFIPLRVGGTAATLDVDFTRGAYVGVSGESAFTVARTGVSSTGLSTDATGSAYTSWAPNVMRIVSGAGLRVEEARTQYLGVTDTPATQTTASLNTGTYTLWVVGSGSAATSAGTATITGAGTATAGTPNVFTVTVSGTVTVTVTGTLTRFQLENGSWPSSYIPNPAAAGTSVTRPVDSVRLTSTNFSSWFTGGTSGTLFVHATMYAPPASSGAFPVLLSADDNSSNNRIQLRRADGSGSPTGSFITANGGAVQANEITSPIATSDTRLAYAFATNDIIGCANGLLTAQDTSATIPTPNQLFIGSGPSATTITGFIRRIAYFPARLTNAQLQGLTG